MRIVSWNLGHQTVERPLKAAFGRAVHALAPDTLVLNEYVDGPSRVAMKEDLARHGLACLAVSRRVGRNNQVLVASRFAFEVGALSGPAVTDAGISNFLHVRFRDQRLELVGVRVPAYDSRERAEYWQCLSNLISETVDRPMMFVGDFNADPTNKRSAGGRAMATLIAGGWQIPAAIGDWSYCSSRAQTRIDHAIVAPELFTLSAEYCHSIGGVECAGTGAALYDHAPLMVEIRTLSNRDDRGME